MQIQSRSHDLLTLNGFEFSKFAQEERPVEFPNGEDLYDIFYGADGGMYLRAKPMLGGPLIVRLDPTSPAAQWCIEREEERKMGIIDRTALPIFEGTWANQEMGVSAQLQGGAMTTCPPMIEAGITFVVAFTFERIISQVSGARFNPLLQSDAAAAA